MNDPSKNPALAAELGAAPEGEGEAPPQPPQ